MKLHDILTEAINLTTHARLVKERIMFAFAEGIKTIPPYAFTQAVLDVEETKSLSPLSDVLLERLDGSLKHTLSRELSTIATNIFVPDGKSYIPVDFVEMADSASAPGLRVNFSDKWLSKATTMLADLVITAVLDNSPSEDDMIDTFWSIKNNKGNTMLQAFYYDHRVMELAEAMSSVFIHELTHVAQHFPQLRKGRKRLEYRSYAGATSEFHAKFATRGAEWDKMYIASPQEIGARAQELALQVLQSLGLAYGYERDIPPTNEVAGVLQDFVDEWYPQPKTDRDRMIRKRYIKLAYQQIDRHLQQLREKQKQRDN